MRLYNNRILQIIGISIISVILSFALNSCRDEIVPIKPIIIGEGCDTNNVSYVQNIEPLFKSCITCHGNSTDFADVNLEGYDNFKKNAVNGKILSSLLGGSMIGYFSGTDCDILKIKAWINQGSKNN